MPDEMLRIAGRGDDGLAKAIKTDNDGNVNVQLQGSSVKLLDVVTVTGAGTAKAVGVFKTYVFEVWGTATSFTLQIKAVGPSGTPRNLKVWDELNNVFLNSADITVAGFYSVSLPSFTNVLANVSSISGGNINVSGGLGQ
jgi:hypothetical protein